MEQFKICEKETKTKAYSKEGLAREEKPDPQEAERQEKLTWLNNVVDRLREIVESQESDLEKLSNVKKGKNREQVSTLSTY
jgi:CCR4-NOT transcription complex subunit 3